MRMGSLGGIAESALDVFGVDMMVRANNIANVNTPGFHSQDVSLMTGVDGRGVVIGSITTGTTPGPYVPGIIATGNGGHIVHGIVEGSTTDVATEFVRMLGTQYAHESSTVTIRAADEMLGTLLDIKV